MTRALVVLLTIVAAGPAAADSDEFAHCTTCHGADGNGNPAIKAPKLAGMERWYIEAQLAAFRDGWRGTDVLDMPGHEMRPVAAALPNESAMARAAAYVSAFTPVAPPVTVEGDAARGSASYTACATCHGADGRGKEELNAPALAGQNDWYLVTQLKNYRDGHRGTHEDDVRGATMRPMAAVLVDDAAIADVVAYINSLH